MVGRQRTDSQQQTEMRPDDFVHQSLSSPSTSRSGYQRLQFRRMYRYGLSLLLVGALCNWIGFAQHYFAPVRYLGVGCVVAGALCICIAMCRWLSNRSNDSSASQVCTLFSIRLTYLGVVNTERVLIFLIFFIK